MNNAIIAMLVPCGEAPRPMSLDTGAPYAAMRECLGGEVERLWPCSDPDVMIVCRKNAELLPNLPLNRQVTCAHGAPIANIFGSFCVVSVTPDGVPADMPSDTYARFADKFAHTAGRYGYGDDCPALDAYTEDFAVESPALEEAGVYAEYHADTRSLVVQFRDVDAALRGIGERARRNHLWETARATWAHLTRGSFGAQINYLDDNTKCTVCGDCMVNRLRDGYALSRTLAHVRHPEKKTHLTMAGW